MKITKIFHSCILIEEGKTKILIDPGSWVFSEKIAKPKDFSDVDAVLITHEHPDHLDSRALTEIKKSGAKIISNKSVHTKLKELKLDCDILDYGETTTVGEVNIKAIESPHGTNPIPMPENVGFIIQEKLFHPGDSLRVSNVDGIEVYMAPITAPWATLNDAVEATKKLRPKIVIPIHDGYMKYPFALDLYTKVITEKGVKVKVKTPGEHLNL